MVYAYIILINGSYDKMSKTVIIDNTNTHIIVYYYRTYICCVTDAVPKNHIKFPY